MSKPFTPEQEEFIDKFLEDNKELMQNLAKAEEAEKKSKYENTERLPGEND